MFELLPQGGGEPVNAIPTKYNGVQFRSRLEARWAAQFDLLGWRWEYEPIDLDGYIPDFLVYDKVDGLRNGAVSLYEVKPAMRIEEFEDAQRKIDSSGWWEQYEPRFSFCEAVCVGVSNRIISFKSAWYGDQVWRRRDLSDPCCHRSGSVNCSLCIGIAAKSAKIWREAGNRVQWRGAEARP
jgi:hypothetical protein